MADWVIAVGTLLSLGLLYQQNRILARQGQVLEQSKMRRYWPMAIMLLMMLGVWGGVAYDAYDRHHSAPKSVLTGWSISVPNTCGGEIDPAALSGWGSDYKIALICGIEDPSLDKNDDARITVTRLFTIPDSQSLFTGPFSKAMLDGINSMLAQSTQSRPSPVPGTQLAFQWNEWIVAVMLPANTNTTDIHTLSDVSKLGGSIIDGHGFSVTTLLPGPGASSPTLAPKVHL